MNALQQALISLYHELFGLWYIIFLALLIASQVFRLNARNQIRKNKASGKNVTIFLILTVVVLVYGTVTALIGFGVWH